MSKDSFYLLDSWSTLRTDKPEEWLGRVVSNHQNPLSGKAPKDTSTIRGDVLTDEGYSNVSELLKSKQGTSIYAALADVLKFSTEKSHSDSPEINAAKVAKLSISDYADVLKNIKADAQLHAAVNSLTWTDRTAYLIVGLLVTDSLKYTESLSSRSAASLDAKVPTKEIAMAVTGGIPVDVPTLEGGGEMSKENSRDGGAGLEGKRIFAIQYQVLRKHRYRDKKGIKSSLSSMQGERTFGDDGESGPDALEMVLEENVDLEDEIDDEDKLMEL
ncbi:hypothetical protein BT63DRAFT_423764 [Microthyrium microscopicum]|uniref:Uncharacterized protein n=1 Tax=Microthyrium microscopicum TaxID=703497 RepID=A0A6A6UBY4_9PEZI|nr:hypothetical protein BT63DRAFT_423764 [Microthyrium microscopicum]